MIGVFLVRERVGGAVGARIPACSTRNKRGEKGVRLAPHDKDQGYLTCLDLNQSNPGNLSKIFHVPRNERRMRHQCGRGDRRVRKFHLIMQTTNFRCLPSKKTIHWLGIAIATHCALVLDALQKLSFYV